MVQPRQSRLQGPTGGIRGGGAVVGADALVKVGGDLEAAGEAGLEHLRLLLRHAPQDAQRPR